MPAGKPNAIFNPREAWTVVKNAHEALVDQGTFDAVQAKIQRRRRRPGQGYRTHTKGNGDAYLLTGLVYCQHCGRKMHGGHFDPSQERQVVLLPSLRLFHVHPRRRPQ